MKLFPFTTLRSKTAEPSLADIARRLVPFSLVIGLGVGGLNAFSHPDKAVLLLLISAGAAFGGGLAFILLFYGITRLAAHSGYKPFVYPCPPAVAADAFAAKLIVTLQDLGFKPEEPENEAGSVWVLQDKKQEAQIFINKFYPLRAFLFRQELGTDRRPHLVLQIKGTPIWDTGETQYLAEIGAGIVTLAGFPNPGK